MPTKTAAASGGNWNATTTWVGASVPTAADDTVLASTSGNVTITAAAACRSLDCTGYTGTLAQGALALNIGDATAGTGNVALKLVAGMTFTNTTGVVSFISTSVTQQTVTTAGNGIIPTFNGAGGSWLLSDALTVKAGSTLTLTTGALNTNNQAVSCAIFTLSGATTRSLTLGTSTVTLTGTGTSWNAATVTNLTFSGASAGIALTNANATARTFAGGGLTYGTLDYTIAGSTGALTISGANTFNTLNFSDATNARTLTFTSGTTTTVTNWNVNGSAGKVVTLNASTGGTAATVSKSTGTASSDYLSITDSAATGGATWTATHSLQVSGDSGWSTTYVAIAVAAGGTWSVAATWDTLVVPTAAMNVQLNATSGNVSGGGLCRSLDCTGYTGTLAQATIGISIGDATPGPANMALKLVAGMTYTTTTGSISFASTSSTQQTVTSAGKGILPFFSGVGGSWILSDGLTASGAITYSAGSLDTNSQAVSCTTLAVSGAALGRTLTLGTSTISLTSTGTVWNYTATNLTFSGASSTIASTNVSGGSRTFAGTGQTYGTLTYTVAGSTGTLIISGANTFNTLNFSDATNARTLTFPSSATTTVTNWNVNGSAGKVVTINASLGGTAATVSKASGTVTSDFLSLTDSAATGGATWTATHSLQVSGNSGWSTTYVAIAVAAGGTWSVAATWDTAAVPTVATNVQLNASSGNVTLNPAGGLCRSLDCTGYTGTLSQGGNTITIGDATPGPGNMAVKLVAGMTVTPTGGTTIFASTSSTQQTVTTAGKGIIPTFSGAGGSWILSDGLAAGGPMIHSAGTLDTNNQAVSCTTFSISGAAVGRTLTLGTSTISLTGTGTVWNYTATNLTFSGASSTIVSTNVSATARTFAGTGQTYGIFTYTGPGSTGLLTISGSNTFDTLNFSDATNARTLSFTSGTTTTVTTWNVTGGAGRVVTINATTPGTAASVSKASGAVTSDYLSLKDSSAIGGASWTATHSVEVSGDSGWVTANVAIAVAAGGVWGTAATWDTLAVPTANTNVQLNATSGSVTISATSVCRSLDCTGYTGTLAQGSQTLSIGDASFGIGNVALYMVAAMTYTTTTGVISFVSTSSTQQTVTAAGKGIIPTFNGVGGSWILQDNLTVPTAGTITLATGIVDTNNTQISTGLFASSGAGVRTLTLGTSTITLTGTGTVWNFATVTNLTFSGASATILITNVSGSARTFAGGGLTYGPLSYVVAGSTGTLTVSGSNTFTTFNFSDASNARTLTMTAGTTTTVTNWNVNGATGAKLMTLQSSVGATAWNLVQTSGAVASTFVSLTDSHASGGATFTALWSQNVSGNTGWNISNIYKALAGGGNWTAAGTWDAGVVPINSSEVSLDATSGNVTINATAVCRSLDCTGYTGTLTHVALVSLSVGDALASGANIAVKFSAAMTYAIPVNTSTANTSQIVYLGTSTTPQTLTTAGQTMPSLWLNTTGSTLSLQDNVACSEFLLVRGTLTTNDHNIVCLDMSTASQNSTVTLNFGASVIQATSNGTGLLFSTGQTLNVNAGTSTLISPNFTGPGKNWYNVATGRIGSAAASLVTTTFVNLTGNDVAHTSSSAGGLSYYGSVVVTGTLTIHGVAQNNRTLLTGGTNSSGVLTGTITAANLDLTNVNVFDVTALGGNWDLSAIPGLSGNVGGNSGITFTTPSVQTWSGTQGGSWAANAWTTHMPLPQDNVRIASAFDPGQNIVPDTNYAGHNIDFTGTTGSPTWGDPSNPTSTTYSVNVNGSLTYSAGMGDSVGLLVTLTGSATDMTVTTAGRVICRNLVFSGSATTAKWTFQDDWITPGQAAFQSHALNLGTIDMNNHNFLGTSFGVGTNNNFSQLIMGTGTWTLYGTTGTVFSGSNNVNSSVSAAQSTIVLTGIGATTRTFAGGGQTYGTLTYNVAGSTGQLTINGSSTFDTINFSDTQNARTLAFAPGSTQTVNHFNVWGSPGNLAFIVSTTPGTFASISKAVGVVRADYLSVQDSHASGGANFYAGSHSTDTSGNSGWLFVDDPAYGHMLMMGVGA